MFDHCNDNNEVSGYQKCAILYHDVLVHYLPNSTLCCFISCVKFTV